MPSHPGPAVTSACKAWKYVFASSAGSSDANFGLGCADPFQVSCPFDSPHPAIASAHPQAANSRTRTVTGVTLNSYGHGRDRLRRGRPAGHGHNRSQRRPASRIHWHPVFSIGEGCAAQIAGFLSAIAPSPVPAQSSRVLRRLQDHAGLQQLRPLRHDLLAASTLSPGSREAEVTPSCPRMR
jgi:hypothetical protein